MSHIILGIILSIRKSHSIPQPDVHEDLHMEYEKIVTKFEVLKQVEGNFKDSFDAKGFLSDIFMVSER